MEEAIYSFGFKLAELIGKNEVAGIGLLCLSIKDAGKDYHHMDYQDYKEVFQKHLFERLGKFKVADREQVVSQMLAFLNQKQSLLTMANR